MMCRIFDKLDILEARLDEQNVINMKIVGRIDKVKKYACFVGIAAVGYAYFTYSTTLKLIKKQSTKIEELQNRIDESEEMKG